MAGILFDLNGLKVLYGLAFCIFYARNAHRRLSQPTVCMFSLEPISKIIDLSVWVLWYKEMFVPFRPLPPRSPGRIKNFIDFLCENISPFNQIAAEKRKTKSKKKRSASLKYWIFTVKHSIWLLKSSHQELYDSQKESLRNILVKSSSKHHSTSSSSSKRVPDYTHSHKIKMRSPNEAKRMCMLGINLVWNWFWSRCCSVLYCFCFVSSAILASTVQTANALR